jgi:ABC-2 type transport system ATP-binding protein
MQLIIKNLSKTYSNGVQALKNMNLTINSGMFGLLGPNGAGKSSLMRTIATLQDANSGSIQLGDIDVLKNPEAVRRTLGYLPQEFGVYPNISALDLLDHIAVLKGINQSKARRQLVDALLYKTNLYNDRKKHLSGYSGGMKQRFGIAQALLSNPTLIIVDEPTAGLDPAERNRFLNLLGELSTETIVILSTHIVEDVKELCTDMAIINKGEIIMHGNPLQAIEQLKGKIWTKRVEREELKEYKEKYTVISDNLRSGKPNLHIISESNPEDGFDSIPPDLEDVYFTSIQMSMQGTLN